MLELRDDHTPPAPFHVTPRGFAGPNLLAMIMFEKFGQHQPRNRQSERYRREGIDLSLSTLADQVGACTTVLQPLHALIEAHVLAADRLHGDDTNIPILAKGKTIRGTSGPMSGTIVPLAVVHRRRRCTTPRGTDGTNIPFDPLAWLADALARIYASECRFPGEADAKEYLGTNADVDAHERHNSREMELISKNRGI